MFKKCRGIHSRSQCPRGRRRSAAAHLLRTWVRIPAGAWMFVCCDCCVLSGRSLCDELITRPEESYRLWCVVVCDLENLKNEVMTRVGSQRHRKKKRMFIGKKVCLENTPTFLKHSHSTPIRLWKWNRQSVPKRRHIKFRRRGITQKKTYSIQNTAKVWKQ